MLWVRKLWQALCRNLYKKTAGIHKERGWKMKLVIAEKPSVAKSIGEILGADRKKTGYLEGNGWYVSWCLGHMAGLANAEQYRPDYARWRREDLPIIPDSWQLHTGEDKKKQLEVLRKLLNAPDVELVVNACDAGREGELIFRRTYGLAQSQKPVKRLWISSMEDSAIREGFRNLKPGSAYDALYAAALARANADWLVGINATRLFSVVYGKTLNIGRVMTPTLALIVERESKIGGFEPETFYNVILEVPGFSVSSEAVPDLETAQNILRKCEGKPVEIQNAEQQENSRKPPALHDMTSIQREANRRLGYTAQQTADYLQNLYEKKLCTYPRTDSRYLPSHLENNLTELAQISAQAFGWHRAIRCNGKQVICDKKVTDHHALLPTVSLKTFDLDSLPVGERKVLGLIAVRLLAALEDPSVVRETKIDALCGGHLYTAKGSVTVNPGWKVFEKQTEERQLPDCKAGAILKAVSAEIKEGKTRPPKHFTEDTLLLAMENAGKEEIPEEAERKGLGTSATRAAILEKLVSAGFAERRKNEKSTVLIPSADAFSLIGVLPEYLQSPLLTADWEALLLEIEKGELHPDEFLEGITEMLRTLVSTYQAVPGSQYLFSPAHEAVGKCPRCGGRVVEMKKGFFCQQKDCKFAIWKNSKWWAVKRKIPTADIVKSLLRDGMAQVKGFYSEKTGSTYDAAVTLEDDGTYVNFRLLFDSRK